MRVGEEKSVQRGYLVSKEFEKGTKRKGGIWRKIKVLKDDKKGLWKNNSIKLFRK